jgi:hypothetical protein
LPIFPARETALAGATQVIAQTVTVVAKATINFKAKAALYAAIVRRLIFMALQHRVGSKPTRS